MISRMCLRFVSGSKFSSNMRLSPSDISDLVGSRMPYSPGLAVKMRAVLLSMIMRIKRSSSIISA